jgi:lipopolysaccharide export system protein LptC
MLSPRQRLLALALATVGAVAWWLQHGEETPAPARNAGERRPDYRVDNLTATTMDKTGRPEKRLFAVELRHYPDDDTKELQSPRLTLFEEEGPPWVLRSESARVSADDNLIWLQGEVYIDRARSETTREVHLKTSEALLKRKERYAETDRVVRITSESDWTTADSGARLWLQEKLRAKLLGRVRGEMSYE